jgi:hypothetical protein
MPVINKGKPVPLKAGEVFGGGAGILTPYKPGSGKTSTANSASSGKSARLKSAPKVVDPSDPLHEQIDSMLGQDPAQRLRMMQELFPSPLDARPADETEEDGKRAGELRLARWKHQNEQFRKKRG